MIRRQLIHPPEAVRGLFAGAVLAVAEPRDRPTVAEAFLVAVCAHHGQTRDEGTPYIDHPVRVAALLAETGYLDAEVLSAGLLHDVIEDCGITQLELEQRFSPRVGALVQQVSKRVLEPGGRATVDFRTMCWEARAIKLADRLDNLRSLERSPHRWKQRLMLEETYWRYLPVARELGDRLGKAFLAWWSANARRISP